MSKVDALAEADARWQRLADLVQEDASDDERAAMLSPLGPDSWRVDTYSIGWSKPRSLSGKVALMEKLDALLTDLPGDVELDGPDHVLGFIEDWRGEEAFNVVGMLEDEYTGAGAGVGGEQEGGGVSAPSRLFFGRQLSVGAASHLADFALSERPYLGRTTLPPELALLMANQARVLPGSLVLDPFCGTASTLLSCAARGARVIGVEIDE